MSDTVVRVVGLSKKYRVGRRQRYRTLRESLVDLAAAPYRSLKGHRAAGSNGDDHIWALKDMDFEVKAGEVVGVIGRNGAGKSTLLKVLSRITDPTEGFVDIYGHVGSLLEVGTGFHNELTGRENIYLNGAILGMKRHDIQRKFDDIVSFAEVEKFIDTPVKHYSSGMYLRLAFAVAAHLEPDTLLVDEVLAVGDMAFQKRCLGKMGEVAREGRTVLFVSHNMGAIRCLCERGLVIDRGRVVYQGDVGPSIEEYYRRSAAVQPVDGIGLSPSKETSFGAIRLEGRESTTLDQSEGFEASVVFRIADDITGFTLLCLMVDMQQRTIFHLREESSTFRTGKDWRGTYKIRLAIPPLWLEPGMYSLYFKFLLQGDVSTARYVSDSLHIDIGGEASGWGAVLTPRSTWNVETISL